jgi:cell division protein FtsZ
MAKSTFSTAPARIKAIGIGGGGSNAITRMVREGIKGVEFIAMNTDAQALAMAEVPIRVQLGEKLTRGLGAGGDPSVGNKAADESRQAVQEVYRLLPKWQNNQVHLPLPLSPNHSVLKELVAQR